MYRKYISYALEVSRALKCQTYVTHLTSCNWNWNYFFMNYINYALLCMVSNETFDMNINITFNTSSGSLCMTMLTFLLSVLWNNKMVESVKTNIPIYNLTGPTLKTETCFLFYFSRAIALWILKYKSSMTPSFLLCIYLPSIVYGHNDAVTNKGELPFFS